MFSSMIKIPHALLALSAMGVMSSNVDLVTKTMKHLEKLMDDDGFRGGCGFNESVFPNHAGIIPHHQFI